MASGLYVKEHIEIVPIISYTPEKCEMPVFIHSNIKKKYLRYPEIRLQKLGR